MGPRGRWALAVLLALATGCGTTRIVTDDPAARIYADGVMVGRGQGDIRKRGFPRGTLVVVASQDGRHESTQLRREFTATTFLFGLFTYGTCLLACWEHPSTVFLPVSRATRSNAAWGDAWAAPPAPAGQPGAVAPTAVDPWLQPPPGYTPRQ